jgi:hypothetical protein
MPEYDEVARVALIVYRDASELVSTRQAELDALGRTDVPLDDDRHISNATSEVRSAWWAKYKQPREAIDEETRARQKAFNFLGHDPRE